MPATRPVLTAVVLAAAATGLTACSATATSRAAPVTATASPSSSASPSPSASASPSPSGSPTGSPTASPTAVNLPTCQPAQLSAQLGTGTVAAGHLRYGVVFTNHGAACQLTGYPGLLQLTATGQPLPTTVIRGGGYTFPPVTPTQVTLATGGTASFALDYSDVPAAGETSCPTSAQLEVTPPNDYGHLVIPGKIAPCQHGTIHVSPVVAGATPPGA